MAEAAATYEIGTFDEPLREVFEPLGGKSYEIVKPYFIRVRVGDMNHLTAIPIRLGPEDAQAFADQTARLMGWTA